MNVWNSYFQYDKCLFGYHAMLKNKVYLLSFLTLLAANGLEASPEAVLVWVRGESITTAEFDESMRGTSLRYLSATAVEVNEVRRVVLQELIDRRLLLQEARRRGLVPDGKKLLVRLAEEEGKLAAAGESYNREALKNRIREDSSIEKLIAMSLWVVEPSREEVMNHYWAELGEFQLPNRAKVQQVLVKSRKKAKRIMTAALHGGDFETLARSHSVAPEAQRGGNLGWVSKKDLPSFLWKALEDIATGSIGGPLKSRWGYHILRVEERKGARMLTPEEAVPMLREDMMADARQDYIQGFIISLRSQAEIKVNPEYAPFAVTPAALVAKGEK